MRYALIIALVVICVIGVAGVAYFAGRVYDTPDPLAAQKLELDKLTLTARIERLRIEREAEKRKTAVTLATLTRQRRIAAARPVESAEIALAVFLRTLPMIALTLAVVGATGYYALRKIPFEYGEVKTYLPARAVPIMTERALIVAGLSEQARIAAYEETLSRARVADAAMLFKSLRSGRETTHITQETPALPAEPTTAHLPTFQEIFNSRELHGDLILGYEGDTPRLGRYEAVHSCLIYGLARSGKTSWLRGLIGQTILTEPDTICYVLDPHQARKDSLFGSLPKTQHFQAIDCNNPLPALEEFGAELRRRLLSEEESFPPRILLIDELNQLTKEPYKPQLVALCEAVCQRGRKVNVFLLATAQDLREKKIGDFRTSISSAYFFKGKSSQVKAFLADSDAERVYRRNVTRHGVALFSSADEEPRLMSIPECRPQDLLRLGAWTQPQAAGTTQPAQPSVDTGADVDAPEANVGADVIDFAARREQRGSVSLTKSPETPLKRPETDETLETKISFSDEELRAKIVAMLETPGTSLSGIAAEIGVNKGVLYRFVKNGETPSETTRACCMAFLRVKQALLH